MATLTHSTTDHHLHRLADFISQHIGLLKTHPNDGDVSIIPDTWTTSSEELARYYSGQGAGANLPESLKEIIDGVRELELPRNSIDMSTEGSMDLASKKGMSPKKLHEVQRLATYVKTLVDGIRKNSPDPTALPLERLHIVDVGAGQGYLTRALGALFPTSRLLALDADHSQTEGAERFTKTPKPSRTDPQAAELKTRIDHRTVLITPESLLQVVDDWIDNAQSAEVGETPIPVLFVALHACGSLTPDLLRAFLSRVGDSKSIRRTWRPLSIVAIGCCYNLMFPGDYPLSRSLRPYPASQASLPIAAYHLAAQTPMTWLEKDPDAGVWKLQSTVQMAIRKVTWRALLQSALDCAYPSTEGGAMEEEKKRNRSADVPVKWWALPMQGSPPGCSELPSSPHIPETLKLASPPAFDRLIKVRESLAPREAHGQGEGATEIGKRLGKLPPSAYTQGWGHFLTVAAKKLGVSWATNDFESLRDPVLEKQVEILHTLRCFLGSAVESAILLDRLQWVREELGLRGDYGEALDSQVVQNSWSVELVNLFDQGLGSGRNVAVVIAPIIPPYK